MSLVSLPDDRRVDFNPTVRTNNGSEHRRTLDNRPKQKFDASGRLKTMDERISDMSLTLRYQREWRAFEPRFRKWQKDNATTR